MSQWAAEANAQSGRALRCAPSRTDASASLVGGLSTLRPRFISRSLVPDNRREQENDQQIGQVQQMARYPRPQIAGLLLVAIAIAACEVKEQSSVGNDIRELKEANESLEMRVADLEVRLTETTIRLDFMKNQGRTVAFDPANSKGYSRLDTDTGTFLVSVEKVTPYLDGVRVTCNFGNPSAVSYQGFKLKAKWGPRLENGVKGSKYFDWQESLQEKDIEVTDRLRPGAWNPVSFVVSPAKADQFGYLELSMETSTISLSR